MAITSGKDGAREGGRGPGVQAALARLPLVLALLFVATFVLAPLVTMAGDLLFEDGGLSFGAFGQMLATEVDRQQFWNTIWLGLAATAVAALLGFGHAWLTERTDLPGAAVLGPLGVLPLVMPPILVAMGFADFLPGAPKGGAGVEEGTGFGALLRVSGFAACVLLLAVSYAPFVAVLAARGLRSVDGRTYEAAWLARGRGTAERLLLRLAAPEVAAGCLLAFVFVVGEHGVPEFLTVKGKTWHTYAEGIFSRFTRRSMGLDEAAIQSPVVAALPLVAVITVSLWLVLRLRARATLLSDLRPLPRVPLGAWRWPSLLLPLTYLGAGVGVPVVVMLRWAAGSTHLDRPTSLANVLANFRGAVDQTGPDLTQTLWLGALTTALLLVVGLPLARFAARRARALELVSALALAVPAVLLGIGIVKVFNRDLFWHFYDTTAIVACTYAARFLPFVVLPLSHAVQRVPSELEEAASLCGRGPIARALRVHGPLLLPAAWSAACLVFVLALRELDLAVVLPAGNGTVVRRLSNIVHFGGEDTGGALALLLLLAAVLVPGLTMLVTGRKLRSLA